MFQKKVARILFIYLRPFAVPFYCAIFMSQNFKHDMHACLVTEYLTARLVGWLIVIRERKLAKRAIKLQMFGDFETRGHQPGCERSDGFSDG